MNKTQRKELAEVINLLGSWADEEFVGDSTQTPDARKDAVGALEDLQSRIETLTSDEREKFDNMPEGLQASDTGQNIEAAADALDNASNYLGDAIGILQDKWDADSISALADAVQQAIDEAESF